MAPKIELAKAVTSADLPAPPALKPPVDPATLAHRELLGGAVLAARSRPTPSVTEARVPRSQVAGEELDHQHPASCSRRCGRWCRADVHRGRRARASSARRCACACRRTCCRSSTGANPYEDPLRTAVHPARVAAPARSPASSTSTRCTSRPTRRCPGSPIATPTRRSSCALDTCPVYCRFCTRSYAVGIDTEEVEKVQLKVNAERWQQAFAYIASRPELEDIVISGGDAYQLRAEQITRDRRDAARRCRTSGACASRPRARR